MTDYMEIELKLRLCDSSIGESLFHLPLLAELGTLSPLRHLPLVTTYYDTEDFALGQRRLTYRTRQTGDSWEATVKGGGQVSGGLHQRQEWTVPLTDNQPTIEGFLATPVGETLCQLLSDSPLVPLFVTRFQRISADLTLTDGSCVEIALDMGEILANNQQETIQEIELELKSGSPATLLAIGAVLSESLPLIPDSRSKYFRGLQLAGLTEEKTEEKKSSLILQPEEEVTEALTRVLGFHISQVFLAQEKFLASPENAEGVHQLRVSLRRLRALLSFCRPLMKEEIYLHWQGELRQVAQQTAILRETDVLLTVWDDFIQLYQSSLPVDTILAEHLDKERASEMVRLISSMSLGQTTSLYLGFWADISGPAWKSDITSQSIADFVYQRISRWLKYSITLSPENHLNDPEATHSLRVRCKKIRYALDVFAPLFPKESTEKLIKRLAQLQFLYGTWHDAQVSPTVCQRLIKPSASRIAHRDMGLLMGWQARDAYAYVDSTDSAHKKFNKIARIWLNKAAPK